MQSQATELPAASIAALAAAVAPMPLSLTAEPMGSGVDHFHNLGILSNQASLLESEHVDLCQPELGQRGQRDFKALNFKVCDLKPRLGRRALQKI